MSTKTPSITKPLVLAVVLVVLGGLTYWLEYGKKPKEAQLEAEAKRVFLLKNGAVSRLEIAGASIKPENSGRAPLAITLTCESLAEKLCKSDDASKWQMAAPLKTKADDATVNSVLKNFGNLVSNDSIDLTVETPEKRAQLLKDYGLDSVARANPRTRRISITLDGGVRLSAYFGVKHPIGENVFALTASGETANEGKVYIVPDWQLAVFDQKTSYFRDKALFGFNENDISAFNLAVSKKVHGALGAKRGSDATSWMLHFGKDDLEGDRETVNAFLSGVAHLTAKDVIAEKHDAPEAKAALLGSKTIYDLKFTTKSGEKHLRVLEKKKDPKAPAAILYALIDDQDPVYEVDPYALEKAEKTLDEFRIGKLLNTTERYAIDTIDVDVHGTESFKQHVAKESGGVWMVGGTPAARGIVEEILDRLSSKIINVYSGSAPSGALLKMTFRKGADPKAEPIAVIEFWNDKGKLFARNTHTVKREIVELASDFFTSLPWKAKTLIEGKSPGKGSPAK
jgi:hypothetical protein